MSDLTIVSRTMKFELQDCINCKIAFLVPEGFTALRRRDCATFYCPNGHPMVFSRENTPEERLRRERDRLKQETARLEDEKRIAWNTANEQLELRRAAERRASASRGQITKLKKRAANGVCPCCNRTFANLARHMQTKHAGFIAEAVAPEGATLQ